MGMLYNLALLNDKNREIMQLAKDLAAANAYTYAQALSTVSYWCEQGYTIADIRDEYNV